MLPFLRMAPLLTTEPVLIWGLDLGYTLLGLVAFTGISIWLPYLAMFVSMGISRFLMSRTVRGLELARTSLCSSSVILLEFSLLLMCSVEI